MFQSGASKRHFAAVKSGTGFASKKREAWRERRFETLFPP
jgi:hypothetical protein